MASTLQEPNPFVDLLHAINSYVEESLQPPQLPPQFHHFLNLPLELRYNIYEQYFKIERKAVLCRSWPHIAPPEIPPYNKHGCQKQQPLLPNICFINGKTGKEALVFFISTATLEFNDCSQTSVFRSRLAAACSANGVRVQDYLRKISIVPGIGTYVFRPIREEGLPRLLTWAQGRKNRNSSELLKASFFDNIRQLTLTWNTFAVVGQDMHNIYTYRPIPMDNLILDFDMDSVTRLQQLRKVFFVATTPFAPVLEGESVETEAEYREKDLDHLRALVDVARTVKAKFQVRGRNVTVQVRLDVHPFGRYLEETIR